MPSSACKTCARSEEHTSELQSPCNLVCRLLLEKKTDHRAGIPYLPGPGPRVIERRKCGAGCAWQPEAVLLCFFFNDTATTEIYTLSLHDALPISGYILRPGWIGCRTFGNPVPSHIDRKSTRLNSSHLVISYAVFCLKKKKKQ